MLCLSSLPAGLRQVPSGEGILCACCFSVGGINTEAAQSRLLQSWLVRKGYEETHCPWEAGKTTGSESPMWPFSSDPPDAGGGVFAGLGGVFVIKDFNSWAEVLNLKTGDNRELLWVPKQGEGQMNTGPLTL